MVVAGSHDAETGSHPRPYRLARCPYAWAHPTAVRTIPRRTSDSCLGIRLYKLEADPVTAPVVARIFAMFLNDCGHLPSPTSPTPTRSPPPLGMIPAATPTVTPSAGPSTPCAWLVLTISRASGSPAATPTAAKPPKRRGVPHLRPAPRPGRRAGRGHGRLQQGPTNQQPSQHPTLKPAAWPRQPLVDAATLQGFDPGPRRDLPVVQPAQPAGLHPALPGAGGRVLSG
jgi:hypothetical protein